MTLTEALAEYRALYRSDAIGQNNEMLMGALMLMVMQSASIIVQLDPDTDE